MLEDLRNRLMDSAKKAMHYDSWNSNVDQKTLISEAKTVFDIGANVGQTSTTYRKLFPSAEIWAFEPVPDTFAQLAAHFKDDRRIHLVQVALGDERGTAVINRGKASITDSMLVRKNRTGETLTIQTNTVDAFCAENSISDIDILKVDVEGMEARVFAGASGMFRKRAIRAVFTEVFFLPTYQGMPLFCDLNAILTKAGFLLYGLYSLTRETNGRLEIANALYTLADRAESQMDSRTASVSVHDSPISRVS